MMNNSTNNVEKTNQIIKKGARITFRNLPFIIIIILTFILVGLTELIKSGFNWEVFTTSNYWFNIVLVSASGFLIAIASTIMKANSIRDKDKEGKFKEANNAIAKVTPNIQNTDIDDFLEEVNRGRKTKAYKQQLEKKLSRIEKMMTTNHEIEYVEFKSKNNLLEKEMRQNYETDEEYFEQYYIHTLKAVKGCSSIVQKKVLCILKLNALYIDLNIDKLVVKYTRITRKFINVGTTSNVDDGLPNKASLVLVNGLLPRILLTLSITTTLLTFTLDIQELSWLSIFPILVKCLSLLTNFINGYIFAPVYVEQVYLDLLYVKIYWLTLFNDWSKKRGLKN